MTQPALQRGPRGLRPVGWALGVAFGLALLVIAGLIWFFGFVWPQSGERAQRSADEQTRGVAQTIAEQLRRRSADGQLSRAEITEVIKRQPAQLVRVQLDGNPLTVIAEVHGVASGPAGAVGSSRCYQFIAATPVGPSTRVDAIPLDGCPPSPEPS